MPSGGPAEAGRLCPSADVDAGGLLGQFAAKDLDLVHLLVGHRVKVKLHTLVAPLDQIREHAQRHALGPHPDLDHGSRLQAAFGVNQAALRREIRDPSLVLQAPSRQHNLGVAG